MRNWILKGMLLLMAATASPAAAAEIPLIERYFESLRERGLYVLGEEYAAARLSSSTLSSPEQLVLTIEFARTLVEHGILQQEEQRQELWDRAAQVLSHGQDRELSVEEKVSLEIWSALLEAMEGNAMAFRAELNPEQVLQRQQAVDRLQLAIRRLQPLDSRLETAPAQETGLTKSARQQFLARIRLAEGEALLWLARLGPESADRNSLRQQADNLLGKADRTRSTTSNVSRKTLLLLAAGARLQGDDSRAEKLLERISTAASDSVTQDLVLAERIRLELGRGQLDQAVRLAINRFRQSPPPADELRAVAVDALIQAAELAAGKGDAVTEQQALEEARRQQKQTFGIWGLKASALLQRADQDRELGVKLAGVVRHAMAAWQDGNVDQAIERYAAASDLARQTGLTDQAFEYALTQASILVQQQRWSASRAVLQEVVDAFPQQPRRAEAHLLLCFVIGQESPQSSDFSTVLREHLQQFPDSATTSEARWMLAVDAEQRSDFMAALENYRQISDQNSHKGDADLRITMLLEQLFKAGTLAADQVAWNALAAAEIRRIALPHLTRGAALTSPQCRTLLQCLKLCLLHQPPLLQDAERLLSVVQKRVTEERRVTQEQQLMLDADWETLDQSAVQLQLLLLASQKKLPEARELLQQRARENSASLLNILATLTDLTSRLELTNRHELGALQRMTVNELATQRKEMTPEQQFLLDKASLQASLALQDWSGAVRTLEDLHKEHPRDASLLRQLINASMQRGTQEDLKRAREAWNQLEQLETAGSPGWIEARLQIARLLSDSGDLATARKLLAVTRTLYPRMGTPELKQMSDQLWQELQTRP